MVGVSTTHGKNVENMSPPRGTFIVIKIPDPCLLVFQSICVEMQRYVTFASHFIPPSLELKMSVTSVEFFRLLVSGSPKASNVALYITVGLQRYI